MIFAELTYALAHYLDWARHAMYAQMMGPLKASMLAERISRTYMRVSDLYIMPAQRSEFLDLYDLSSIGDNTPLWSLEKSDIYFNSKRTEVRKENDFLHVRLSMRRETYW